MWWVAVSYVVGGLLEIVGISLVALDVHESRKQLRDYVPQDNLPHYVHSSAWWHTVHVDLVSTPASMPDLRLDRLESNVETVAGQHNTAADMLLDVRTEIRRTRELIDRAVAGNLGRRAVGVGVLPAGVICRDGREPRLAVGGFFLDGELGADLEAELGRDESPSPSYARGPRKNAEGRAR